MSDITVWGDSDADSGDLARIIASARWDELNDVESFFACVYRGDRNALLFCDRLGLYPLYYCTHNSRLFAAPCMAKLLESLPFKPTFSVEGVLSLFLFGHHLADETVFQEIRRCKGGQVLEYSNDMSDLSRRKWRKPHTYNGSSAVDGTEVRLAEAFVRGVETAVTGCERIIIPLSGGFDSRAVLGAVLECSEAERIHAVTFGGEDALDFRIGHLVARRAGVRSIAFPIVDRVLFEDSFQRRRARDSSYGYSVFATQPPEMIAYLAQEMSEGHLTVWGAGGDAATGSHLHQADLALNPCETFEDSARLLVTKRAYLPLNEVTTLLGLHEREALSIIAGLLERSSLDRYEKSWQFLDAWDIFVRGRMELISVLPFSGQLWRCPHLCREYFGMMATQGFDGKIHQNAYRRMLASRFGSLFSLPSKRGKPLVGPSWRQPFSAVNWLSGKVLRRLVGSRDAGRNYGRDHSFLHGAEGRERLRCSVDILLQQGLINQDGNEALKLATRNPQLARMLITARYALDD